MRTEFCMQLARLECCHTNLIVWFFLLQCYETSHILVIGTVSNGGCETNVTKREVSSIEDDDETLIHIDWLLNGRFFFSLLLLYYGCHVLSMINFHHVVYEDFPSLLFDLTISFLDASHTFFFSFFTTTHLHLSLLGIPPGNLHVNDGAVKYERTQNIGPSQANEAVVASLANDRNNN